MDSTERAALAEQYADAENLDARIDLHQQYEIADRDWWRWVFDHYETVPDDADILEVGCGTGDLWATNADRIPTDWDLLVTDFSMGMGSDARETLADAGVDTTVAVAAAESLPIPDESVDVVVANHMLYHTDRESSLPEIHRVLRPGGRLFATTNGESNMRELRELRAATTDYEPSDAGEFTLENGLDQLAQHFDSVDRYERDSFLRVTDLEPLVAHTASLSGVKDSQITDFADQAAKRLADGPWEIEKSGGLFVAEKR
jgi:ubiquinone/menaquinone biosynthesis C-methylase UbiE